MFLACTFHASAAPPDFLITKGPGYTRLLRDGAPAGNSDGVRLELSGSGSITLSAAGKERVFRFSTGAERTDIYLYNSFTGFTPEEITVTAGTPDTDVFSAGNTRPVPDGSPLPADIGHIIFSGTDGWRDSRHEIYSWNLLPQIIIFDTADYKVQSRYFKRLAFFVEKPGFVGRLARNEEIEDRHGWNAHDYKAEDLARFFSDAETSGFPLNDEEYELRDILLNSGIIKEGGSGGAPYTAGNGAVLSVSRQSPSDWRYRFLTHECLHGIFFSSEAFRAGCYDVWDSLDEQEREFWKRLLDYRGYDRTNRYLMVNEFMAYSLQQPEEEVDEYFKGFMYVRLLGARPYETEFVKQFEAEYPGTFRTAAEKLEKVLYGICGRKAGHLYSIMPDDIGSGFFDLFPPL